MSDWAKVRRKSAEGKDWRGTANVPLGDDDTAELSIRMLGEEERIPLTTRINMSALAEHQQDGDSEEDVEQRVQELQAKDDLSENEQAELNELHTKLLKQRAGIMDALGKESFEAIMEAGMKGIVPDEEDIAQAHEAPLPEQRERFCSLDGINEVPTTEEEFEEALKKEMQETLKNVPYPIKFTVGMQVLKESKSAGGNSSNVLDEES